MLADAWLARWMSAHGAQPHRIDSLIRATHARTRRFPLPVSSLASPVIGALDRLAPAALLGRFSSAHKLDDDAFFELENALQHHRNSAVRAAYTLARFAALESLYADEGPTHESPHPLDALMPQIRGSWRTTHERFDVIVIGSGAGGAPLAHALGRAGWRVAIVESGKIVRPTTTSSAIERHYVNQAMVGSVRGGLPLLMAGNAVGGTTPVNSGTSFHALPSCLERWDAMNGTQLASELGPYMDAASDKIGVTVPDDALLSDSARIIRQGLAALGHGQSFTLPRNAPTCKGAGRCCFGCPNGAKLSTDRSYLPEAVEAGVTLLWDTRASQIRELDDGVEVLVHGHGGRQLLRADKLVLAAGALGTPHLIRSNGLGGRHREAGHGLRMHPATKVFGMMPDALKHGGIPQGLGYRTERLPRVTFEGVHTPPGAAAPVLSVAGSRHLAWMNAYDRLATYGLMVRDRATGTVQGMGQAKVLDYALDPEDAQDLGAGVLMVAEALFLAGAERVLLPLVGVDPEVGSMDALQRWSSDDFTPDKLTTVGFHPQGTAGMGRIVDRDCKLIGSERIWVGDASVMPDSPGVNPQVTIMGLALRLADHLQHEV